MARAFGADARVARIGRGELHLVEDAGQVGQLVDDDLGPRLHHGALERVGIEHVNDHGVNACGFELARRLRRARHAGDVMAGGKEQRRQAAPDRPTRAGEKDFHGSLTPRP